MAFEKLKAALRDAAGKKRSAKQEYVQFLGSMLVKYPEIHTVAYDPGTYTMTISFAVTGEITKQKLQYFANLLIESIKTHRHLEGRRDQPRMEVRAEASKDTMILSVDRDIRDLYVAEIDLMADLMQDCFGDQLLVQEDTALTDEFIAGQEALFGNLLETARQTPPSERLSGYRDAGRVIVYNGRL